MDPTTSAAIEHNQQNTLLSFPDELLLHILRYVDPKKLVQMQRVCQRMRDLLQDRGLWEQIGSRLNPPMVLSSDKKSSPIAQYGTYQESACAWLAPNAVITCSLLYVNWLNSVS